MKKAWIITLAAALLLISISGTSIAANSTEIRGPVVDDSSSMYTWTAKDFGGFYYDIDKNITTEEITFTVTDRKLLEPDGVVYISTAMEDDFDFDAWGGYLIMGFLDEPYFAGYIDTPDTIDDILFEMSDDENVLADEQLLKILIDTDDEITVKSGVPVKLEEGYELDIKADSAGIFLELSKDGKVVDSDILLTPNATSTIADTTYVYRKDVGDSKDVVIIAANFEKILPSNKPVAILNGLWQLSDTPTDVSENTEYDKMTIQTVTDNSIMMNNEDNDITLSNDKDVILMVDMHIITADPSSDEGDVLRWYIYKDVACECG